MVHGPLPLAGPCFPGQEQVQMWLAMTRSLSLIHKNIAESAAKVLAAQQKSSDSLDKVVDHNQIALAYLVTEQGVVCAVTNTTCQAWLTTSGEVESQLHKITEQALWFKRQLLPWSPFCD